MNARGKSACSTIAKERVLNFFAVIRVMLCVVFLSFKFNNHFSREMSRYTFLTKAQNIECEFNEFSTVMKDNAENICEPIFLTNVH